MVEKNQVSRRLVSIKNLPIKNIHLAKNTLIAIAASAATFVIFTALVAFNVLNPQPLIFIPFWITMITIGAVLLFLRKSTGSSVQTQPSPPESMSTPIDQSPMPEASETLDAPTQVNNPVNEAILVIKEQLNTIEQRETEIIGLINHLTPAKQETIVQANQPGPAPLTVAHEITGNSTQGSSGAETQPSQTNTAFQPDSLKLQSDASNTKDVAVEVGANAVPSMELGMQDAPQAPPDKDAEEITTYLQKMDNYTQRLAQIKNNLTEIKTGIMTKVNETYVESNESNES